jgi:hypothetical protein
MSSQLPPNGDVRLNEPPVNGDSAAIAAAAATTTPPPPVAPPAVNTDEKEPPKKGRVYPEAPGRIGVAADEDEDEKGVEWDDAVEQLKHEDDDNNNNEEDGGDDEKDEQDPVDDGPEDTEDFTKPTKFELRVLKDEAKVHEEVKDAAMFKEQIKDQVVFLTFVSREILPGDATKRIHTCIPRTPLKENAYRYDYDWVMHTGDIDRELRYIESVAWYCVDSDTLSPVGEPVVIPLRHKNLTEGREKIMQLYKHARFVVVNHRETDVYLLRLLLGSEKDEKKKHRFLSTSYMVQYETACMTSVKGARGDSTYSNKSMVTVTFVKKATEKQYRQRVKNVMERLRTTFIDVLRHNNCQLMKEINTRFSLRINLKPAIET